MAEVINLRRARKARAKSKKEEQAANNRLVFGQPKSERLARVALRDKNQRQLDAHKLEVDPGANGGKP